MKKKRKNGVSKQGQDLVDKPRAWLHNLSTGDLEKIRAVAANEPFAMLAPDRPRKSLNKRFMRNHALAETLKSGGLRFYVLHGAMVALLGPHHHLSTLPQPQEFFFILKPERLAFSEFRDEVAKLLRLYGQDNALIGDAKSMGLLMADGSDDDLPWKSEQWKEACNAYAGQSREGVIAYELWLEGVARPASPVISKLAFRNMGVNWFDD